MRLFFLLSTFHASISSPQPAKAKAVQAKKAKPASSSKKPVAKAKAPAKVKKAPAKAKAVPKKKVREKRTRARLDGRGGAAGNLPTHPSLTPPIPLQAAPASAKPKSKSKPAPTKKATKVTKA